MSNNSRVVNFILKGVKHLAIVHSTDSEFTYENYMDATPKTDDPDVCFYFMKEDGAIIPPEIFIPYVNQNFCRQIDDVHIGVLNLNTTSDELSVNELKCFNVDKVPTAFMPKIENQLSSDNNSDNLQRNSDEVLDQLELKDLESFIVDNGGEYLLNRYREDAMLSDPHRKALVAIIVKKLTNEHSFWPSKAQKIKYAKLAVALLPIYKTQSVHDYELFYDPEKQKGYINSRLKTIQKNVRETTGERKQKKRLASTLGELPEEKSLSENIDLEVLQTQHNDDIEFLKNCPSSEQSAILDRMKKTHLVRKSILGSAQKFPAIWNLFPCYLTTPNIDYLLYTGCSKTNSIISEFVPRIFSTFTTLKCKKEVKEGVDDEWDSFTNSMLTLLKLLPSYRKRQNKKLKTIEVQTKSDNIFSKVIVFFKSNNSLEQPNLKSDLPIIVAVGPVKKTILQYYIQIDGKLLPTKENCTSIEAFDSLFKAYTVFDCMYDWELKTFFEFIQYFVYDKIEGITLTTRQKEIWKLIAV